MMPRDAQTIRLVVAHLQACCVGEPRWSLAVQRECDASSITFSGVHRSLSLVPRTVAIRWLGLAATLATSRIAGPGNLYYSQNYASLVRSVDHREYSRKDLSGFHLAASGVSWSPEVMYFLLAL